MIREAAYYHYVQRSYTHGHDVDDWLEAEAEINAQTNAPQLPEGVELPEFGVQQSSMHGMREDEALKRIVRQHPRRGIAQVESFEPQEEAPLKE